MLVEREIKKTSTKLNCKCDADSDSDFQFTFIPSHSAPRWNRNPIKRSLPFSLLSINQILGDTFFPLFSPNQTSRNMISYHHSITSADRSHQRNWIIESIHLWLTLQKWYKLVLSAREKETQRFVIVRPGAMHVHVCLLAQLNPDSTFSSFLSFLLPKTIVLYFVDVVAQPVTSCCVICGWMWKRRNRQKFKSINLKLDCWLEQKHGCKVNDSSMARQVFLVHRWPAFSKVSNVFCFRFSVHWNLLVNNSASRFPSSLKLFFFIALTTKSDAAPLHTCYCVRGNSNNHFHRLE